MAGNIYSVTNPWAPQEAQVTIVGLSLVVIRFIAVQTWHCAFENVDIGSLVGGSSPGSGGASGGNSAGVTFRPTLSSYELSSVPTGAIPVETSGGIMSGEEEGIGAGGAIPGTGFTPKGMFSVSGANEGVW